MTTPAHPNADRPTPHVTWAKGGDIRKIRQALGLRELGKSSGNIPSFASTDVTSLYKRLDELKESLPWREGPERLMEEWNRASLLENDMEALLNKYGPLIWGVPLAHRNPETHPDTPVELVNDKPLADNLLFQTDRHLVKHHLLTLVYTKAVQKFLNIRLKNARAARKENAFGQLKPSKKRKRATCVEDGDYCASQEAHPNRRDPTPRATSRPMRESIRSHEARLHVAEQVARENWSGDEDGGVVEPGSVSEADTDCLFREIDRLFKNTTKEHSLRKDAQSCCNRLSRLEVNPWDLSTHKLVETFGLERTLTGRFFNFILDASERIATQTEWAKFLDLLSEAREREARERGAEGPPKLQPRHVLQAVENAQTAEAVQDSRSQSGARISSQEEPVRPVRRARYIVRSPTPDSESSEPPSSPHDPVDRLSGTADRASALHDDLSVESSREDNIQSACNAEEETRGEGDKRREGEEGPDEEPGEEPERGHKKASASDSRHTLSRFDPEHLSYIRLQSLADNRDAVNRLLGQDFRDAIDPSGLKDSTEDLWDRFHETDLRFHHIWDADLYNIRTRLGDDLRSVKRDVELWFAWRDLASRLGRALQYHPFEPRPRPKLTCGEWVKACGNALKYFEFKMQLHHYHKLLPWNRTDTDKGETQFFTNVAKGLHVALYEPPEYYDMILSPPNIKLKAFELDDDLHGRLHA